MKTIHKYPLEIKDLQVIKMHCDDKILTVQMHNGAPCIWAIVDTENEMQTRLIYFHGTGNLLPDVDQKYIGTFQLDYFVYHVFEPL